MVRAFVKTALPQTVFISRILNGYKEFVLHAYCENRERATKPKQICRHAPVFTREKGDCLKRSSRPPPF